jgi:hypothetical protein
MRKMLNANKFRQKTPREHPNLEARYGPGSHKGNALRFVGWVGVDVQFESRLGHRLFD